MTQEHRAEANRIYDEPFGQGDYHGVHDYNARVIACNRWRDSIGSEIGDIDPVDYIYPRTMAPRIIRGRIRYFNVAPKRYGYRLERQNGTWILTVAARFHFPSSKFPNRLDIPMALAGELGIANTICASTQKKIGGIDRGLVQIDGWPDACRLNRDEKINGVPVTEHLMQYWRDTIQEFWTRPGFQVRVRIVNLGEVSQDALDAYGNAVWPVRLNHNKNARPMFRSSPHKPHPLYAGLDGAIVAHEFGHVIGLDDEYSGKKNPPDFRDCQGLGGGEYAMCVTPPINWTANRDWAKGVYPWIVTRRYGFGETTDLEPAEPLRTADTGQPSPPEPEEEEQTASGEYVPPPPVEDLVNEETRELAKSGPTDTNVQISPATEQQPAASVEALEERLAAGEETKSLATTDPTEPDLVSPTQQQPAATKDALDLSADRNTQQTEGMKETAAEDAAGSKEIVRGRPGRTKWNDPKQPESESLNLAGNATRDQGGAINGKLIAHFPLDGSPDNALGEPGEIYTDEEAAPPRTVSGKFGQAYEFTGKSVIAAPLDVDFGTYPKITVTAWVKLARDREASGGYIFSTGPSNAAPHLFFSHDRLRGGSAGQKPVLYEGEPIPLESWTLVAGVWDFENHTLTLYDGDASDTFSNPDLDVARQVEKERNQPNLLPPDAEDEDEPQRYVFIGALDFGGGWVAEDVAIDDVRIYAGALDDAAIAALRKGSPPQVAGRDKIGETEKNLQPGQDTASAVPSGVQDDLNRLAQSEGMQETDAQRTQRELLEQMQSDDGGGSSATGSLEDYVSSERMQESDAQRAQRELQEQILAGSQTGSGGDTGGDPPERTTSSEPETRQQALEPARAQLEYGDRIYHIGDISGSSGSYGVTKTFFGQQAILSSLGAKERKDKPCRVELHSNALGEPDDAETIVVDNCESGTGNWSIETPPRSIPSSHGIVRLQICESGLRADRRVKGVRATTKGIKDDGSLTTNSQTTLFFERPNCGSWANHSSCSNGTVATGVKLYFSDGTRLAPRDYLTGVALMCSQLQPVE